MTVYVVTGFVQYDEESAHWNARAFKNEKDAHDYIPGLKARVEEYIPKLQAYLKEVRGNGIHIGPSGMTWEEFDIVTAKERAAEQRFRDRVGDQGFCGFMNPWEVEYKVETLEVF